MRSFVSGELLVEGAPAKRSITALTWDAIDTGELDGEGQPVFARVCLGETESDEITGLYQLFVTPYTGAVLVVAQDDYGTVWTPSATYSVGDRVHPTPGNETGYVYDCLFAGTGVATEPEWWIVTGGSSTGNIGTAVFQAKKYYQPIAHGPVIPDQDEL
jgi:hypothetical protein